MYCISLQAVVLTPYPSDPKQEYIYLMCLVTAWRMKAATTAHVSCYIEGYKGQSPKHCLTQFDGTRTLFQSGSEEWFLIFRSLCI